MEVFQKSIHCTSNLPQNTPSECIKDKNPYYAFKGCYEQSIRIKARKARSQNYFNKQELSYLNAQKPSQYRSTSPYIRGLFSETRSVSLGEAGSINKADRENHIQRQNKSLQDRNSSDNRTKNITFNITFDDNQKPFLDASYLEKTTKMVIYDPGFKHTAGFKSSISDVIKNQFVAYRSYPMESLLKHHDFGTISYFLIYGTFPDSILSDSEESKSSARVLSNSKTESTLSFNSIPESLDWASASEECFLQAYYKSSNGAIKTSKWLKIDWNSINIDLLWRLIQKISSEEEITRALAIILLQANSICQESLKKTSMDYLVQFDRHAQTILSLIPIIVAYLYRSHSNLNCIKPRSDLDAIENFMYLFANQNASEKYSIDTERLSFFNTMLSVHTAHGSTLSATITRMITSTHTDLINIISSGILSLSGDLEIGIHGKIFKQIDSLGNNPCHRINEMMAKAEDRSGIILGISNRHDSKMDPRAIILKDKCTRIIKQINRKYSTWLDNALALEEAILQNPTFKERSIFPNVDFYMTIGMHLLQIPEEFFNLILIISKSSGWCAHAREQLLDLSERPPQSSYSFFIPRQVFKDE